MFTNLKIGQRLFMGFGVLLFLMVTAATVGFFCFRAVGAAYDIHEDQVSKTMLALDIRDNIKSVILDVGVIVGAEDRHLAQQYADRVMVSRKDYLAKMERLRESLNTEKGKSLLQGVEEATAKLRSLNSEAMDLAKAGKQAEARKLYVEKSVPEVAHLEAAYSKLRAYRMERMEWAATSLRSALGTGTLLLALTALLAMTVSGIMGTALTRGIVLPLQVAMRHLQEVADGDMRRDVPQAELAREDEIGAMARALQRTVESLRTAFKDMLQGGHLIASASTELSALSGEMAEGTRANSLRVSTVAAAAEEMSVNAGSVASGMEQATSSFSGISEAISQMTNTIAEIAGNAERARGVTSVANQQASGLGSLMQDLGHAAKEIGKVTEAINSISSQTNLLALNATIEAARAGSAGKGFAVVAGEIKALAHQTARATEDIKSRITAIQNSTSGAVADIQRISGVIHDVSDIVSSIATAIEEQSAVTRDIAGNLGQASRGVQDANIRVAESTGATQSIASDIAKVDQSTQEIADRILQVKASASDLSRLSERLNGSAQRFLL